ncbi:MAG: LPS biosynthesis protein [Christensenellaceae bacterium]|jgi:hypothetical protein
MQIDGNPKEKESLVVNRSGDKKLGMKMEDEFIAEVYESIQSGEDHCTCPAACRHHGKCLDCVAIHRGHRDHLPYCFFDMVNERLAPLSDITEGTLTEK